MINFDELKSRYDGDTTLISQLTKIVQAELDSNFPNLKSAFEENDHQKIKFYAHKLKGSVSTLYAKKMATAFQKLENLESGSLDALQETEALYQEFQSQIDDFNKKHG